MECHQYSAKDRPKSEQIVWVLTKSMSKPALRMFVFRRESGLSRWYPGGYCQPGDVWAVPEVPPVSKMQR